MIEHPHQPYNLTSSTVSNNRSGNGGKGGDSELGFAGNGGDSGNGGGICIMLNSQVLLDSSVVCENQTGNGGDGGIGIFDDAGGGDSGSGGGIFSSAIDNTTNSPSSSQLTLISSTISDNRTGNGGNGNDGGGDFGGNAGDGGGIFTDLSQEVSISSSSITGNRTGNGGNARVDGGFAGSGGGIYNIGADLAPPGSFVITSSIITGNQTRNGGNAILAGGPGGQGGGIFNVLSSLTITSSTISSNQTGNGGDASNSENAQESNGGPGGSGGGLLNGSSLKITTSTISSNQTGNGGNGNINDGRSGNGGGIEHSNNCPFTIESSTITANQTGSGGNSEGENDDGAGLGGGIFLNDRFALSSVESFIENSIVAGNFSLNSPNIDGEAFTEIGSNILSGDPLLAPLANYGGPTETMPPLPGSPAIDAGGSVDPDGNDQRELPRFVNGALDIGAVELQTGEVFLPFLAEEWALDNDQDGTPNGIESIIGRNPLVPDSGNTRDLAFTLNDNGDLNLRFGKNDTLPQGITLRLLRSVDLTADSFELIGTYDSTSSLAEISGNDNDDAFTIESGEFSFIDADQPAEKAFYRIEADYDQP